MDKLTQELAELAGTAAVDKLGEAVKIIKVQAVIGICDYFVIASGQNPRQVKAISESVEAKIKIEKNIKPRYIEGFSEDWLLMDYGDIVVHIFTVEARQYYDLERLWVDCPEITSWS